MTFYAISAFSASKRALGLVLGLMAMGAAALAQTPQPPLKLADPFTDHAVMQRDQPLRIWGQATPGSWVEVRLGADQGSAMADAAGKWRVDLAALKAGGPYTLEVRASFNGATTTKSLADILIGDVYLCSGQSNMEYPYKWATNAWGARDVAPEPQIRFYNVKKDSAISPRQGLGTPASWEVAGPGVTGEASAVCYTMGRAIQAQEKVPVGLIDSYWGGTIIQAWMSEESLKKLGTYDQALGILARYRTDPDGAMAQMAQATENDWVLSEPDITQARTFIDPKYDDRNWDTILADGPWENAGILALARFDGVVWYRAHIRLNRAQAAQAAHLALGPIDDADQTWVNGLPVGHLNDYATPRDYAVAPGILKTGDNVITVRVLDTGGGGGLWGKPKDRALTLKDGTRLALPDRWKFHIAGPARPGAPEVIIPWQSPNGLSNLYNAMIAPLAPYGLKGVAWYQGEANVNQAKAYKGLLGAWMADWRARFEAPGLPFLIVQLTAFGPTSTRPENSAWAQLRESQSQAVVADPHAALAVTLDVGDRFDIHPTQKTVVGNRLAQAASVLIYGHAGAAGGPVAQSVSRDGADLVVNFKDADGGLKTYSAAEAIGFEACSLSLCHYVRALPEGGHMRLLNAASADIVKVRYGWADSPFINLFGTNDIPAAPFDLPVERK